MVVPTPKKPLFEGNHSSNSQSLFFEFAFEPTAVSSNPPTVLSPPPTRTKRKKFLFAATRLAFGLLITALIMGSGILNNELIMGKSAIQADLGWIPSWSADASAKSDHTTVASVSTTKTSETTDNPAAVLVGSENNTAFSSTVAVGSATDLNLSAPLALTETETENPSETTEPTPLAEAPMETKGPAGAKEPTKKVAAPFRPFLKAPVTQSEVKVSSPVVNREAKQEITSEAFHEINAQAAIDGKKVFIKFGARWCLPCKMMEANVFPDPEISQKLAEDYHVFTVDVDNLDGINLRQFYQVEAIPSFIILDDTQNIIGKHEGAKRIEELRSILGNVSP